MKRKEDLVQIVPLPGHGVDLRQFLELALIEPYRFATGANVDLYTFNHFRSHHHAAGRADSFSY